MLYTCILVLKDPSGLRLSLGEVHISLDTFVHFCHLVEVLTLSAGGSIHNEYADVIVLSAYEFSPFNDVLG